MSTQRLGPNAYAAWDTFTSRGVPDYIASALVGNMLQESGRKVGDYFDLTPDVEGDGGNSKYAVQWNGPRRKAYEEWVANRGTDPTDIREQALRVLTELGTTEKKAFDAIFSAEADPERIAAIASEKFWRPGDPRTANRMRYARMAADQFKVAQNTTQANDAAIDPFAEAARRALGTDAPAAPEADPFAEAARRALGTNAPVAPVAPAAEGRLAPGDDPSRVPAEMVFDPSRNQYVDTALRAERVREQSPWQGPVQSYLQQIPAIGTSTDEFQAWVNSLVGENRNIDQETFREIARQFKEANPTEDTAIGVMSAILSSLGLGKLAAPFAVAHAPISLGGQMFAGGLAGMALGGVEGYLAGLGAGTDRDSRIDKARQRAIVGVLTGGVVGTAAPPAIKAMTAAWNRLRPLAVGQIAAALGISRPAAEQIRLALDADDMAEAVNALRRAEHDAMLVDAGDATKSLLDIALQTPFIPRDVKDAIKTRLTVANRQLDATMDGLLGKPRGIMEIVDEVADASAVARAEAFDAAFATPLPTTGPIGAEIDRVLGLIPPDLMAKAVKHANDEIALQTTINPEFTEKAIMAQIAPDGTIRFIKMPTVRQLHELKRMLQSIAEDAKDPITQRLKTEGIVPAGFAKEVRRLLFDATGGDTGTYATAMKLGGDKIAQEAAVLFGRRIMSSAVTREEVAREIATMAPAEKRRAAEGLRSAIDETLANVKRTMKNPNIDARQLSKIVIDMSAPANMEKITALLGPERARLLEWELDRAGAALDLMAALVEGSRTAIRRVGQESMKEAVQPNLFEEILGGAPLDIVTGTPIRKRLLAIDPKSLSKKEHENYREVARGLTLLQGRAAYNALISIKKAIAGEPLKKAQQDEIVQLIISGLGLAGYRLGSQTPVQTP